jgi:hypothetical protein
MRLPFLQVDQDALVRARTMARLLKIPEPHGVGLAVSLFAWGLEMAGEDDLSGRIVDDQPAEMVAAGVGWERDPGELYKAFQRVGFIELAPADAEADRIKGLDRYESVLEERRKDRERKASKRSGGHPEDSGGIPADVGRNPADSTRQTQTQTQTQTQKKEKEEETAPPSEKPDPRPAPGFSVLPPTTPPEQWLAGDFWRWAQSVRMKAGLAPERLPNQHKLQRWWSSALMVEGVTVRALMHGFERFGQSDHWETTDPPYPFAAFMSQWEQFTRLEVPDEARVG